MDDVDLTSQWQAISIYLIYSICILIDVFLGVQFHSLESIVSKIDVVLAVSTMVHVLMNPVECFIVIAPHDGKDHSVTRTGVVITAVVMENVMRMETH